MIPIVELSREDFEERYPRTVAKAVREIRDRAIEVEFPDAVNRHERRKAAALARRAAR